MLYDPLPLLRRPPETSILLHTYILLRPHTDISPSFLPEGLFYLCHCLRPAQFCHCEHFAYRNFSPQFPLTPDSFFGCSIAEHRIEFNVVDGDQFRSSTDGHDPLSRSPPQGLSRSWFCLDLTLRSLRSFPHTYSGPILIPVSLIPLLTLSPKAPNRLRSLHNRSTHTASRIPRLFLLASACPR
ncbi:hypothetical protein BDV23DRAFT_111232 [Aspergillus alliaceus]|uniref:Uncharacterized protein n=1 Tax=Petromyces alliaceus TaxID=209559 RepID=A0A5N7C376_PETAA|nr:hypothetical protein BDV23DRAFT_111232 [Aspergillus alliaceus]